MLRRHAGTGGEGSGARGVRPSRPDAEHSEDPSDPVGGSWEQASRLRGSIPAGTIGAYARPPRDAGGPRLAPGRHRRTWPNGSAQARSPPTSGFDPTADSLHVGSLVPVMGAGLAAAVRAHADRAGRRGHRHGRRPERQALGAADACPGQIDRNAEAIRAQLARFLRFDGGGSNAARLREQRRLAPRSAAHGLSARSRQALHAGIHASEGSGAEPAGDAASATPNSATWLIQAYDFWHLFRTEGCELQIGGSDQWGNITAGIELIAQARRAAGSTGWSFRCITNASGAKFGKSEVGNIWLDPAQDQPVPVLSVLDQHRRSRRRALPQAVHLPAAGRDRGRPWRSTRATLESARRSGCWRRGHDGAGPWCGRGGAGDGDQPAAVRRREQQGRRPAWAMFQSDVSLVAGLRELSVVELLVASGLATSKADARRGIQGKGFYLNDEPIEVGRARSSMRRSSRVRRKRASSSCGRERRTTSGWSSNADPTSVSAGSGAAGGLAPSNPNRPRMTSRTTVLHRRRATTAVPSHLPHGSAAVTILPSAPVLAEQSEVLVRSILAASISRALSRSSGFPYSTSRADWLMSACNSSGVSGAMRDAGGMSRVATTGVGVPRALSTVTTASPIPSEVSVSPDHRRRLGKGPNRGFERLFIIRRVRPQGVLDPVAQLREHALGHVLGRLGHEVDSDAFRADQPNHLLDLVEKRLWSIVEEQVSLVEEEDQLRLRQISRLRQVVVQLGQQPHHEGREKLWLVRDVGKLEAGNDPAAIGRLAGACPSRRTQARRRTARPPGTRAPPFSAAARPPWRWTCRRTGPVRPCPHPTRGTGARPAGRRRSSRGSRLSSAYLKTMVRTLVWVSFSESTLPSKQRSERADRGAELHAQRPGKADELDRHARGFQSQPISLARPLTRGDGSPGTARPERSPFISATKYRYPLGRELFGEQLQRPGFPRAGGACDQPVPIGHRQRKANLRLLVDLRSLQCCAQDQRRLAGTVARSQHLGKRGHDSPNMSTTRSISSTVL